MVSQHYIRHNIQYGYLQPPFWAFLWPKNPCNSKCILVINPSNAELNPIYHFLALLGAHPILHVSGVRVKHLLVSKQLPRHYHNMHLTAEHNGWFTNHHLRIQYLIVYILGFVFRHPTSLHMYISIRQEFNCVMCAVCYSSMRGYACSHLCTHCDLPVGYMWNLQVCNKLCVKDEWGLTAPSKYF